MLSDELVKKLKDFPDFAEFSQYIAEKIEELDSINGLDGLSNEQAGEEARARLKARDKLIEILAPFVEYRGKREPTKEQIKEAKKKAGL